MPTNERPTEGDWDDAIERFQFFRRMEKPDDLRRAKRLPKLLSDMAQEIYDIANELERLARGPRQVRPADVQERTKKLEADLAKYGAKKLEEHIAFNGYAFEVRHRFVPLEFLDELPTRLVPSPVVLRRWAHEFKNQSERAQRLIELYEESVEYLRGENKGGRFPSVAMYWLIQKTDEWEATVPDIARQLIKRTVPTESKSIDPNPQRQWEALLKKGRVRARKRTRD